MNDNDAGWLFMLLALPMVDRLFFCALFALDAVVSSRVEVIFVQPCGCAWRLGAWRTRSSSVRGLCDDLFV